MKTLSKFVLAVAAVASCAAANAQLSASEDAERRARNREAAMANWQRTTAPDANRGARVPTETRARLTDGDPTTRDASTDIRTVKSKTRQAAKATRSFTHRQAEKVRNFGERQQKKYPGKTSTRTSNKSDTALGK